MLGNDLWSREVAELVKVWETPCKYHAMINDDAMMLRVNEMYAEREVRTWTSIDLQDKDVA